MRASSLPLLMKCTGAAVLPCVPGKTEQAEKAADWGTMVHRWVQTGEIVGPNRRMEGDLAKAIEISGIVRDEWWPEGIHEGAVAVRVDGTREASWDDTERDGWITGHYDFRWWMLDELWIDELKTGKFYANPPAGIPGHHEHLEVGENRFPQNVRSPQPKTYALALAELLSYDGWVNVSVTHWPRLPLTHRHCLPTREWVQYNNSDLMGHWYELEKTYQLEQRNQLALYGYEDELILTPGDHCKFCPVRDCFVRQDG